MKSQVQSLFSRIYGDNFLGTTVVPNLGKVDKKFKQFLTLKQKLARAEAVWEASKKSSEEGDEATRPQHKTGPLGLWGTKVDSIEWYNKEIEELLPKLKVDQEDAIGEGGGAALLYYDKRQLAASAAQSMIGQDAASWLVDGAPEPRDLEWTNLRIGVRERQIRSFLIYVFVFLTVCFFMVSSLSVRSYGCTAFV